MKKKFKKRPVIELLLGDCRHLLARFQDNCFDSIVTDPPYQTKLHNQEWDKDKISFRIDLWTKLFRVLKPGGHLLAFGGARTHHLMFSAIEFAGFEIRDSIHWIYGGGVPKNYDLGKKNVKWKGRGTSLRPGCEIIVMARKPLEGTILQNLQKWGTGAINIDNCRLGSGFGRWPSNVIFSGGTVCELDAQSGITKSPGIINRWKDGAKPFGGGAGHPYKTHQVRKPDVGGASRFFFCTKVKGKERTIDGNRIDHPTVKPIDLMRWLVKLVTPPNGLVLDPFVGSGSTGIAAKLEGFGFVGIELEKKYLDLAKKRIRKCRM